MFGKILFQQHTFLLKFHLISFQIEKSHESTAVLLKDSGYLRGTVYIG